MSDEWVFGSQAGSSDARSEALLQVLKQGEDIVASAGVFYKPQNSLAKKYVRELEGSRPFRDNEGVLIVTQGRVLFLVARGGHGGVPLPSVWLAKKVLPGKRPHVLFEYPRADVTTRGGGAMSPLRLASKSGAKWLFTARRARDSAAVRDALASTRT